MTGSKYGIQCRLNIRVHFSARHRDDGQRQPGGGGAGLQCDAVPPFAIGATGHGQLAVFRVIRASNQQLRDLLHRGHQCRNDGLWLVATFHVYRDLSPGNPDGQGPGPSGCSLNGNRAASLDARVAVFNADNIQL